MGEHDEDQSRAITAEDLNRVLDILPVWDIRPERRPHRCPLCGHIGAKPERRRRPGDHPSYSYGEYHRDPWDELRTELSGGVK